MLKINSDLNLRLFKKLADCYKTAQIYIQVTGIAILALGIWMKIELHIYVELTQNYYENTPYVLIGVGCGIVLVGSLGCFCTVKGKSTLLYLVSLKTSLCCYTVTVAILMSIHVHVYLLNRDGMIKLMHC